MSAPLYDPSSAAISYEASGGQPFIKDGYLFADGLNRRQRRAVKTGTFYEELGVKVGGEDRELEVGEMSEDMLVLLQEAKAKARTHTTVGKVKAAAPEEAAAAEGEAPAKQRPAFKSMGQVIQAEADFLQTQLQKKEKVVVSAAAEALITPFGSGREVVREQRVKKPAERFTGILDTAASSLLLAGDDGGGDGDEEALIRGKAQEELRGIHSSWKTASAVEKQYYNKWFKLVFAEGKPVRKPTPHEPDVGDVRRTLLDMASKWATLTKEQKDYYNEWYPKAFPESRTPTPTPATTPVPTDMPHGRKVLRHYAKRWPELSREQRVFYNTYFYRFFPNKQDGPKA